MTRDEARRKALRMAAMTGRPAVLFPCPMGGWDAWPGIEAAKWLTEDGELLMPEAIRDPERTERELREQARQVRGRPRVTLLEAAMFVRGLGVRARVPEVAGQASAVQPGR